MRKCLSRALVCSQYTHASLQLVCPKTPRQIEPNIFLRVARFQNGVRAATSTARQWLPNRPLRKQSRCEEVINDNSSRTVPREFTFRLTVATQLECGRRSAANVGSKLNRQTFDAKGVRSPGQLDVHSVVRHAVQTRSTTCE